MVEQVIEAAVAALMSAVATDVWPRARDRIARALRPHDPAGEGATLDRLAEAAEADARRRGLTTHFAARLREHPEAEEDLRHGTSDVHILIEANLLHVNANHVHLHGQDRPSEAARLASMRAQLAAHELEVMADDVATAHLAAMSSEIAARRLALMSNAATLLSKMDDRLAAELMAAMPPPHPARLLREIDPERGAAILTEMPKQAALDRLAELTDTDPARAALAMASVSRDVAAKLLAELSRPHPATLFSRMPSDRAGALLAAMSRERAVWRISEISIDHAASIMSKMDKTVATELLGMIVDPLCTDLVARMSPSDGAETLAKMDPAWARQRLARMPSDRALEVLVALRPPRSLVKDINGELATQLLLAAVAALARHAEDAELIRSAQAYADRIKAEAEERVQQILTGASRLGGPALPPAEPSLADRVLGDLRSHHRQTSIKIARRLKMPEGDVLSALAVLVRDGRVIERSQGRSGVPIFEVARS